MDMCEVLFVVTIPQRMINSATQNNLLHSLFHLHPYSVFNNNGSPLLKTYL